MSLPEENPLYRFRDRDLTRCEVVFTCREGAGSIGSRSRTVSNVLVSSIGSLSKTPTSADNFNPYRARFFAVQRMQLSMRIHLVKLWKHITLLCRRYTLHVLISA